MNHVRANDGNIFGVQEVTNMKNVETGPAVNGPHLRTEMKPRPKNENEWKMNIKKDMKELEERLPDGLYQLGIHKPSKHTRRIRFAEPDQDVCRSLISVMRDLGPKKSVTSEYMRSERERREHRIRAKSIRNSFILEG